MPFPTGSGPKSEIDQKLKSKRQQIIEEERIRVLVDSFMAFYDKLMIDFNLVYPSSEDLDDESETIIESVSREDVEKKAKDFAATKPIGF
tara:strand:- start:345 stop:614 length:270 start_codon:yes stop_codon:yes gene_type:complete